MPGKHTAPSATSSRYSRGMACVSRQGRDFFLATARLDFGLWQLEDIDLAMGLWGDPEVARFIYANGVSPALVAERLAREIAWQAEHGFQYWPVFLREDGSHVGCCGLRPYRPDEGIHEFGVHIRPRHWRKGFASEAARAVIAHAFDRLGARALFAGHNPQNGASREMLLGLGFRYTHDEFYPPTGLEHPSYLLTRPS